MNHFLTIYCCLAFATVCPAQMLRFESDTVYSYSNGSRLIFARVEVPRTPHEPVTIVPLAQLTANQRSKIVNFLARQPELYGYIKVWADEEFNPAPPNASGPLSQTSPSVSSPGTSLKKAGNSILVAGCIGPLSGIIAARMTQSGNYSGAQSMLLLGGITSFFFTVRAGASLVAAGKAMTE